MAKTNRTRYVILGLLSSHPRTGYDIKRAIEETISHFWSESYGQIYPTLQELVDQGLASAAVEAPSGRPGRKLYTITDAGRAELRTWLKAPVEPSPVRQELLLKLFFGTEIAPEDRDRLIEAQRQQAAALLTEYRGIEARLDPRVKEDENLRFGRMTLRAGERLMEAWVLWCDETLAELQEMAPVPRETEEGE